jgi:hypothetical protein
MVHCVLKRMLVARLKGAEKRANTKPSMMKSIRLEQITWQASHGGRQQQT